MYNSCTFPLYYVNFPFFRSIFIRERIDHVHGHQAFSSLCHEGLFHARTMNIPCTFTDHSLFGFADVSSILTNKVLKFSLSGVDNVICVSHTSRENTVLRGALDPERVFVVPNAVLSEQFTPDPSQRTAGYSTRLIYCSSQPSSHDCGLVSSRLSQRGGLADGGDSKGVCCTSQGEIFDSWGRAEKGGFGTDERRAFVARSN